MHPHIADFMATDRIEGMMDEAARHRLAHPATRSPHRRTWRERLTRGLGRWSLRSGHGRVVRQA